MCFNFVSLLMSMDKFWLKIIYKITGTTNLCWFHIFTQYTNGVLEFHIAFGSLYKSEKLPNWSSTFLCSLTKHNHKATRYHTHDQLTHGLSRNDSTNNFFIQIVKILLNTWINSVLISAIVQCRYMHAHNVYVRVCICVHILM